MADFGQKKYRAIEGVISWVGSVWSLVAHSAAFIAAFLVGILGIASWDRVLLVLTTVVSLEAIYLAIFIQMAVNSNTRSLHEVEEDIDEIQEDVEEIGEEVDEIQEDLGEISESDDVDGERKTEQKLTLNRLTADVRRILIDLETLKEKK